MYIKKCIDSFRFLPFVLFLLLLAGCTSTEKKEPESTTYSSLEELYGDDAFFLTDMQPQPIPILTVEVDGGRILGILHNLGTSEDESMNPSYFQAFAVQVVDDGYEIADASLKFRLTDYKWLFTWDLLDHSYRLYQDVSDEAFGENVEDLGSTILPDGQTVRFGLELLP